MARVWVNNRWVKSTEIAWPDGTTRKISVSPEQLKTLRTLPEYFRAAKFGKGSRSSVRWYETAPDGERRPRAQLYKQRTDADAFAAELEGDIRVWESSSQIAS